MSHYLDEYIASETLDKVPLFGETFPFTEGKSLTLGDFRYVSDRIAVSSNEALRQLSFVIDGRDVILKNGGCTPSCGDIRLRGIYNGSASGYIIRSRSDLRDFLREIIIVDSKLGSTAPSNAYLEEIGLDFL